MRKLLWVLLAVVVLGSGALYLWARAAFTNEAVRAALASQLSTALGQPVSIGSISATIYPRVTIRLGAVTIGEPAGIRVDTLDLGTDFRALLSRRIEHATARLDGATVQLPLIPLGRRDSAAGSPGSAGRAAAPVELVSIDEIVLANVDVTSAGRTVRAHLEVVPEADGTLTLRQATFSAEETTIEATGRIFDPTGPAGELTVTAGDLNLDRLLAFLLDFAGGATTAPSAGGPQPPSPNGAAVDLGIAVTADRATLAGVTLDELSARAKVTDASLRLEPIAFAAFGGEYEGSLAVQGARPGRDASFLVAGDFRNVDLPAVTRFAGSRTDPITGRLSAQIDLAGAGADMGTALGVMRGTARVVVRDGIVRNLGLVRAIVVATSMRGQSATVAGAGAAAREEAARSRDEPFETLSATLAVAGRRATTGDLRFEGADVSMTAAGAIALDGGDVSLDGRVQLSEALTAQAGTDLVRLTREQGRVTLPVSVRGPADALSVRIDVADLMKRAIRNRAQEEIEKGIKGLSDLLKRPER